MKYKINLSKVVAGRVRPDDIIEDFENPKYGFYWWFWLPQYQSNKGKFKKGECVDVSALWLCFSLGLVFWPQTKPSNKND